MSTWHCCSPSRVAKGGQMSGACSWGLSAVSTALLHRGQGASLQVLQMQQDDSVAATPSTCPSLLLPTGRVPVL